MGNVALLGSVFFGLASAFTWGLGDFSGGFATRRARVLVVLVFSQLVGLALLIGLAILTRERAPAMLDLAWGVAAGLAGLIGLVCLYRAMALGQMGIVAPVSGVITAALPVIAGALTQGLAQPLNLLGFVLALAGVWFISSNGQIQAHPASIILAVISGLGFGSFLILIAQTQHGAVFWPLTAARAASLSAVFIIALLRRSLHLPPRNAALAILMAGLMDAGGNLFFVLASQAGRLDVAGVLSSLYPATTVILALTLLHERLARNQVFGVLLALIAIPLISSSGG